MANPLQASATAPTGTSTRPMRRAPEWGEPELGEPELGEDDRGDGGTEGSDIWGGLSLGVPPNTPPRRPRLGQAGLVRPVWSGRFGQAGLVRPVWSGRFGQGQAGSAPAGAPT